MNFSDDEIAELKELCPDVRLGGEVEKPYFWLPKLKMPEGCVPSEVDALLCPTPRDGYTSRLFFAEKVSSPQGLNWNGQERICERNWFAISWKMPERVLRLVEMIAIHLRAFR